MDDSAIVAAVRAGQRDAVLSAVLPQYRRKVYSLAWSIVKDSAIADDVAQDVFVKVWRSLPSFDARASFSTWIYAITRNAAISALRQRRQQVSLQDEIVLAEAETALAARAPEAQEERGAAEEERLATALANLPEKQRQVVTLFYLQGRSYDEVAEMLAMPLGTVKTLLHRARGQLAQAMGDAQSPEDDTGIPS
jgi:RNA polymerase sigma-70 factor (ECF subfamily)